MFVVAIGHDAFWRSRIADGPDEIKHILTSIHTKRLITPSK